MKAIAIGALVLMLSGCAVHVQINNHYQDSTVIKAAVRIVADQPVIGAVE